jgi:hypothetical protein
LRVKALPIICYTENDILGIGLKPDDDGFGLGMPDNIIDLFLYDPENHQLHIIRQVIFFKLAVIKLDLIGVGPSQGITQVLH